MIREQAAALLGGEQCLEKAIKRGAVQVHKQGHFDLYFVPKVTSGTMDEVCKTQTMTRQKATTEDRCLLVFEAI